LSRWSNDCYGEGCGQATRVNSFTHRPCAYGIRRRVDYMFRVDSRWVGGICHSVEGGLTGEFSADVG
jgi:hypothetical protein